MDLRRAILICTRDMNFPQSLPEPSVHDGVYRSNRTSIDTGVGSIGLRFSVFGL